MAPKADLERCGTAPGTEPPSPATLVAVSAAWKSRAPWHGYSKHAACFFPSCSWLRAQQPSCSRCHSIAVSQGRSAHGWPWRSFTVSAWGGATALPDIMGGCNEVNLPLGWPTFQFALNPASEFQALAFYSFLGALESLIQIKLTED